MGYRIKLDDGIVATINQGQWSCSNADTQEILNGWLEIRKVSDTPESPTYWLNSPSTPDKDYLIASEAVKVFGGRIMDEPLPVPPLTENGKPVDESEIIY